MYYVGYWFDLVCDLLLFGFILFLDEYRMVVGVVFIGDFYWMCEFGQVQFSKVFFGQIQRFKVDLYVCFGND